MDARIERIIEIAQEISALNQNTSVINYCLTKDIDLRNIGNLEEVEAFAESLKSFDVNELYNLFYNDVPDNETLKHRLDVCLWNLKRYREDIFIYDDAKLESFLDSESKVQIDIRKELGDQDGNKYCRCLYYIFKCNNRLMRDVVGLIVEKAETALGIVSTATASDVKHIELPEALNRPEIREDIAKAISIGLMNNALIWLQSNALLSVFCACIYRKYICKDYKEPIKWKVFEETFKITSKSLKDEPVAKLFKAFKNAKEKGSSKIKLVEDIFSESFVRKVLSL